LISWQCGHSPVAGLVKKSCARACSSASSNAVVWVRHSNTPRSCPRGPAPLWADCIRLSPWKLLFFQPILLEAREWSQTGIRRVGLTAALFMVQVRATTGAQPAAIAAANHFHRQRQQHLFAQHHPPGRVPLLRKNQFPRHLLSAAPLPVLRPSAAGYRRRFKRTADFLDHRLKAARAHPVPPWSSCHRRSVFARPKAPRWHSLPAARSA